jgi:peptidylprolyl isomerase
MSRLRTLTVAVLSASALALAGCSSSPSSTATTAPPTTVPASVGPTSPPTTVASVPVADPSPAGTFGTKPTIVVPPGAPPTQLQISDLIVGTGATVKAGDKVTVQYVLALYSTGKEFQSSWGGQPVGFTLAEGNVIPGWVQGLVGMRVGGRRELVIPPSLGYGSSPPAGSGIASNDTLVFIVDLTKIG